MSAEFDLDAAGTQEGGRPAGRGLLGANLVPFHSPRLGKLVHVELELPVAPHGVVTLVAVVVSTEATETSSQVGGRDHFNETVTVPRDLQTFRGRRRGIQFKIEDLSSVPTVNALPAVQHT